MEQLEDGRAEVSNVYSRSVRPQGNTVAQKLMYRVFEIGPADWRGFGVIPASGLRFRPGYTRFDARRRFPLDPGPVREHKGCRCGEVLRGVLAPPECELFRRACTPASPVGPCMVSAEGACAAYYMYVAFPHSARHPAFSSSSGKRVSTVAASGRST